MADTVINTYNESSLHNTLKVYYATTLNGKMEVEQDGHIYDVLCSNGNIVEIQTKNLSKLSSKITDAIQKGHTLKLVYPLVYRTRIILTDENGKIISNRLSPKKGSIYDIFKELTGLYSLLLNPKFSLEVVTINLIEHRVRTAEPVQSVNKNRRFKKNWLKTNKRLDEIIETKTFCTKEDYLNLLPQNLPDEFCAKDLNLPKYANIMLWVLSRIPVIELTQIKKKSKYYKKI